MVVSPQRLTRWPSYVRDRHAAITYTTPRDAPFRCRTDVYALRWENRRDGRSGWMPAIKGSWRKGMNRADAPYLPLTLRSLMPTCEAKHISACTHSAMTTPAGRSRPISIRKPRWLTPNR
ncbi:TOTE conflict system archaeo-eukaryotic primase domain-containing protein [Mycobacterium avium]|uniref:TOTE conflict system archaeo-eukaryotic primase domain-containing protein n=1 Tax=Mycobacterium avium TaxID=1764 RepID=UPI003C2C61A7